VVGRALNEILESNEFKNMSEQLTAVIEDEVKDTHSDQQTDAENIKKEIVIQRPTCPECGEELHFEQGCNSCSNCGYSNCG
jgi:ribonucleoside-diphosphate reductase alpha chain